MKRIGVLLAAMMAISTVSVALPAAVVSAASAPVSGVVTDTSGTPIAGATVVVQRQEFEVFSQFRATSDADGRYVVAGVFDGSWKVGAAAPGHAFRWGNADSFELGASITVVDDTPITFDIVLPRTTASISGTVTDPDGAPLEGVQVNVSSATGFAFSQFAGVVDVSGYQRGVLTDAAGQYAIAGLAPTSFGVSFLPQFFGDSGPTPISRFVAENYNDVHGPGPGTPVLTAEGVESIGIDAQLELGATIRGRVTDPDGNPVVGASVYTTQNIEFGGVTTDADGRYQLQGLETGTLQVYAWNDDLGAPTAYRAPGSADALTEIAIERGATYDGFDIQFERYGTVSVTVVRADGSTAPASMIACRQPGVPQLVPYPFPEVAPNVVCTSGGNLGRFDPITGFGLPEGTYNAVGQEGASRFGTDPVRLSELTTFTVRADTPLDCTFVLDGPASCLPTDPATLDGDGVPAAIEDRAPNGGDGNADGIRDATQSNVTSLPDLAGSGFVTLVVPDERRIARALIQQPSLSFTPAETGTVVVRIDGAELGGTVPLTILRTSGGHATELWAAAVNGSPRAIPATIDSTTITVDLVDGGEFDIDFITFPPQFGVDGVIGASLTPVTPDRTPPVITCPAPEPVFTQSDFATGAVRVTVSDDGSGVAGPPPPPFPLPFPNDPFSRSVPLIEAGRFTVEFTFSDNAGNTATATCGYRVAPMDVTPPVIRCVGADLFELGSAATISAHAFDNVALATPADMSQPVDTSSVGLKAARFEATDISGNTATWFCSYTVVGDSDGIPTTVEDGAPNAGDGNFDGIPDRDQSHVASLPEPAGTGYATIVNTWWDNGPITSVAATGFDDLPPAPPGVTLMSGVYRVTVGSGIAVLTTRFGEPYDRLYRVVDGAWVPTSAAGFGTIDEAGRGMVTIEFAPAVVEKTPPTIECPVAAEFDLNETNATITASVTDAGSGVESPTITVPVTTERTGLYSVAVSASDRVGNVATAACAYRVVVRDVTPPTITCPSTAEFLLNEPNASLTASMTDTESGVSSTTISVPVATDLLGDQQATVTATDRAGNTASATCAYLVGVRLERLLTPSPTLVSEANPNQLVGLRWRAVDFFGNGIDDPAHFVSVTSERITCGPDRADTVRTRTAGLRSLADGRWEYGWRAPRRDGCYQVTITVLGDQLSARIRIG